MEKLKNIKNRVIEESIISFLIVKYNIKLDNIIINIDIMKNVYVMFNERHNIGVVKPHYNNDNDLIYYDLELNNKNIDKIPLDIWHLVTDIEMWFDLEGLINYLYFNSINSKHKILITKMINMIYQRNWTYFNNKFIKVSTNMFSSFKN